MSVVMSCSNCLDADYYTLTYNRFLSSQIITKCVFCYTILSHFSHVGCVPSGMCDLPLVCSQTEVAQPGVSVCL